MFSYPQWRLWHCLKITPGGKLSTIYNFCAQANCADGASPLAGLVQGIDGNFYGTTSAGGTSSNCPGAGGCGTVFKITPAGKLTTLHSFDYADGQAPWAGLAQAANGNFYGTTFGGGYGTNNNNCSFENTTGCGTVFEITPAGKLTTLHKFCPQATCTDGNAPIAGLVQATDGNFYGTTWQGGANGNGTVFEITAAGKLTTLHSFESTDGFEPESGLVQAINGNFYGTTFYGGTSQNCAAGCGTIFEITAAGKFATLHSFDGTDGGGPRAGLVQATDGNFYGTTGGGDGTIFEMTASDKISTLHSFDYTDGADPYAGLVQATNGDFYGTTENGDGTVFSLSVGLSPFVELRPASGNVGAVIEILGNNLAGATSVTFDGIAAKFKIVSSSEITSNVPTSATTGKVEVKTPSRTLSSNLVFRVTPSISSFSPGRGPVGTSVIITGEAFTGATSVTFGSVKATTFTVDSDTRITADVPKGAKTGKIGVTTAGGTATSTETFTVN